MNRRDFLKRSAGAVAAVAMGAPLLDTALRAIHAQDWQAIPAYYVAGGTIAFGDPVFGATEAAAIAALPSTSDDRARLGYVTARNVAFPAYYESMGYHEA